MNPGNVFHSNSVGLPIDAIQIFEMIIVQIPIDFHLPGFDRLISHASQKEHRVGEDVGFGIRDLISSVAQQACRAPSVLFVINRGLTIDFCLILDQFSPVAIHYFLRPSFVTPMNLAL